MSRNALADLLRSIPDVNELPTPAQEVVEATELSAPLFPDEVETEKRIHRSVDEIPLAQQPEPAMLPPPWPLEPRRSDVWGWAVILLMLGAGTLGLLALNGGLW